MFSQEQGSVANPPVKLGILGLKVNSLFAFGLVLFCAISTIGLTMQVGPEFAISDAINSGSVSAHAHGQGRVAGAIITSGLSAYWPMDEGAGSTTADASGNGKTGTLVGSPTWVTGKVGGALQFSGSNRVNVPDTFLGNSSYTFAAWVKTTSTDGWVIGQGEGSDLRITGGKVLSQIYTSSNFQNVTSNASINNGQWHHIAVTRSGTTVVIYIDGQADKTATIAGTPENIGFLTLAARDDNGSGAFNGAIDEVYIFNRALSSTEAQTLFAAATADITPPSISVTSPSAGTVLSGTVPVTVNASDNVGIVGVQFKVDGSPLGSEVTTAPFTTNFNTTSFINASHTITATARDAAGNTTTSSAVSVTVSNQVSTAPTITAFTATPASITAGQSATLSWNVTGTPAPTLSINQGVGTVAGTSKSVTPTATTTYTLTATNSSGSVTANTTVTVTVTTPPSTGLVGYWPMDEGAGSTTADASGNGKTGTLVGSPTWVTGKVGGALQFSNGKSVNVPDTFPGNSAFTEAAWVKTSSTDGWVVGNGEGSDLRIANSKVLVQLYTSSNFQNTYSNASVSDGNWHHVAYTISGSTVNIYIDGQLDKTTTFSGTPYGIGFSTLAARNDGSTSGFTGVIDEVRIYNKALSQSEIQSLAGTTTTNTAPSITSFTASSTSVSAGTSVTLSWVVTGTSPISLAINGASVSGTSTTVTPTATTTYTLSASNNVGSATPATVTVNVSAQQQVAMPTVTPPAGTYTAGQSVTLSTLTSGATIRYTTNGTDPTSSSAQYTAPLSIASTTTLKARAFKAGMTDSAVLTASYTINLPPVNQKPTGSLDGVRTDAVIFGWAQDADCANTALTVHLYFDGPSGQGTNLTAATAGDFRSDVGNHAFNVSIPTSLRNGQNHTVYVYALDCNETSGASNVLLTGSPKTFNIPPAAIAPTINSFSAAPASITSGQSSTLSWTVSGTTPITLSINGTNVSGTSLVITPTTTTTYTLTATNSAGSVSSSPVTVSVTAAAQVATPTISPNGGSFTSAQTVTLASTTSGASIRYTTDGSTPSASIGTIYTTPITVATSSTVKAIAYKSGMTDSGIASAGFTITTTTAPVITSFTGSPLSISAGGSSTLSWTVTGTSPVTVSLNGTVVSGTSIVVIPTTTTTYTLSATNSAGSATSATVTITVGASGGTCSSNCISVNPSQTYQTITGWEGTDYLGTELLSSTVWNNSVKNQIADKLVNELGVNSIRLEAPSGMENTVDYMLQFLNGQISESTYHNSYAYQIINDNSDSNTINPAGFQFGGFDKKINDVVIPLRNKLAARGESLNINLNYVDFRSSTFEHKTNTAEYGEFVLAIFQHMQSTFGFVPDSLEIILEPDTTNASWSATQVSNAVVSAKTRLLAGGFNPQIIVPSVTFAGNALSYINSLSTQAKGYVDTYSYHRYDSPSTATVQSIASKATTDGKKTAMLELGQADYNTLFDDLVNGKISAWQQYAMGNLPEAPQNSADNGWGYYDIYQNGTIQLQSRAKMLAHIFKYARKGAQRIGATYSGSYLDQSPLAFQNINGAQAVVTRLNGSPSSMNFGVNGLRAGTYGVIYTSAASGANTQLITTVTIQTGQAVTATLPSGQGIVTVYDVTIGTGSGTSNPAPTISSFTAAPASIAAGSSSTLSWTVNGATSLSINGTTVTGSSIVVIPSATTTYTLTATNSAGSVTATATVTVTASQAVTAPVIFPNGGSITSTTPITITSGTSGASIRYTTDGSNPTSTLGTLYSAGFTLPASSTVKAIAYKSGMTDSTVTSSSFTVSTTQQSPVAGCDYYVATNGSPSGNGTTTPWDLATALNKGSALSGKTLCLNTGTYKGKFTSNLVGATVRSTSNVPSQMAIVDGYRTTNLASNFTLSATAQSIPASAFVDSTFASPSGTAFTIDKEELRVDSYTPGAATLPMTRPLGLTTAASHSGGALVVMGGSTFTVNGSDSTYRDFIITNTDPVRTEDYQDTQLGPHMRGACVAHVGPRTNIVNMIISNCANGIFSWPTANDSVMYGNIIYNNGYAHNTPSEVAGHGIYLQNNSGFKDITDVVSFNNFVMGLQEESVSGNAINIHNDGVVVFNNDLLIGTQSGTTQGIVVKNSHIYADPNEAVFPMGTAGGLRLGYVSPNGDVTVTDNYISGGHGGWLVNAQTWQNITFLRNTLMPNGQDDGMSVIAGTVPTTLNWNNNTYYDVGHTENCSPGGTLRAGFSYTGVAGACGGHLTYSEWKAARSGIDTASTYSQTVAPTIAVVRPNQYQTGRANIAIHNPSGAASTTVNLSLAGLTNGQTYEIRNVQNYLGAPVTTGTYNTSSASTSTAVPISLASVSVEQPVGSSDPINQGRIPTFPSSCPKFCAYVVLPTGTSSGLAAPTSPTQQVTTPTNPTTPPTQQTTAPTQPVSLTPGVSNFKYASSPTVYFLNSSSQKEAYSEAAVFLAWNKDFSGVVTIPDTQTYPDGGLVRLPEGTLVKGSSATIYLVQNGQLSAFTSYAAFTSRGYSLSKVITVSDGYLAVYTQGPLLN